MPEPLAWLGQTETDELEAEYVTAYLTLRQRARFLHYAAQCGLLTQAELDEALAHIPSDVVPPARSGDCGTVHASPGALAGAQDGAGPQHCRPGVGQPVVPTPGEPRPVPLSLRVLRWIRRSR